MARLKLSKAHEYLAYSERKLAEAPDADRRKFWQGKVEFYRRALAGRCHRCGRSLSDPTATVGPECARLIGERVAS